MPELAEVEYYRRRWDPGLGRKILRVDLHTAARDFRGMDPERMRRRLKGATLLASQARGKQMLFRFSGGAWLGIHLGMTGRLRVEDAPAGREAVAAARHDHLILHQAGRLLVFSDPRLFGRVLFAEGPTEPPWWTGLPPDLLSREFTVSAVAAFLRRRARSPIKGVLLMQDRFPGIGNWMADEILWRSGIHPAAPAGRIPDPEVRRLWKEIRVVSRTALRTIGENWNDLPRGWLFHSRWDDGRLCPRTGAPLVRETIAGRTTCWSPGRQPHPRQGRSRRSRGRDKAVDTQSRAST